MNPQVKLLLPALLSALLFSASTGGAQVPYQPGQMGSLPALLGVETVRNDLKLTSSQIRQLDALRKEYRDAARKIVGNASPTNSSKASARKKLDSLTASSNRRALAVLNKDQQKKLAAHEHKYLGATLLYLPQVQALLGLSEQQSERISELQQESETQVNKINQQLEAGEISPHARRALLRKDRLKRNSRLLSLLTSEQKATFKSLHVENI